MIEPMDTVKKVFPIVAIVCSALAIIGWIVFVGGYGYTTTQINPRLTSEERQKQVYADVTSTPIIDREGKVFDANLTGYVPEVGTAAAPFYLTAVLSPILSIIMIVAAILLLVIGQKTMVHLPFAIVIVILLMVIIPNIGAALHTISNAYNNYLVQKMESIMTDFSGYTIIVNPPSYFNAITAGGVLELLFLDIATIFLILAYILSEMDSAASYAK